MLSGPIVSVASLRAFMTFEATLMVSCCIPYDEEKETWKMFASKDVLRV